MTPPIPDKPEVFCTGCQKWNPRATIAATRWVTRLNKNWQPQYFCVTCAKKRDLK